MVERGRWQDYGTAVLGVLLFISPFVFGATSSAGAAVTAYFIGILLIAAGLVAAVVGRALATEWAPVILGVILFVAPWALAYTDQAAMSVTSWVLGLVAIGLATSVLIGTAQSHRPHPAA